jgi:predicted nucleotidyltransferase
MDVPKRFVTRLKELFATHVPEHEVWLFGSRTQGQSHEGSDIDLMVRHVQKWDEPCSALPKLCEAIRESDVSVPVDVLDWALVPEEFRQRVMQNGVRLF